ncbi:hypothetical protein GGF50DRAFT_130661 [Schizophyllum commune]
MQKGSDLTSSGGAPPKVGDETPSFLTRTSKERYPCTLTSSDLCMMAHLPDELVDDILRQLLPIPDGVFTGISTSSSSSYFHRHRRSCPLLVCKAWCRVGTPLLYHDVLLRSQEQANALANALRSCPELGQWIRKLRLEDAFSERAMHVILGACRNVTDFCIVLNLRQRDVTIPYPALANLNPERLVVVTPASQRRKRDRHPLLVALRRSIPKWSKLTTVLHVSRYLDLDHDLLMTLLRTPNLFTVILTRPFISMRRILWILCSRPTIKSVIIRNSPHNQARFEQALEVESSPSVRRKLQFCAFADDRCVAIGAKWYIITYH